MSNKLIIGIDPGKRGGVACIDFQKIYAFPMPEDDEGIAKLFDAIIRKSMLLDCVFIIEQVHASQQMGVSSAFNFGYNYGFLKGCISKYGNVIGVTPQKWQTALNCRTGGDKKISKKKAEELFPGIKVNLKNADALLLAYYGFMKYGG